MLTIPLFGVIFRTQGKNYAKFNSQDTQANQRQASQSVAQKLIVSIQWNVLFN